MNTRFLESDKSLKRAVNIIFITTLLLMMASIIVGCLFFCEFKTIEYEYGLYVTNEIVVYNWLNFVLGFVFVLVCPIVLICLYQLFKFLIWVAYDIKMIRNKMYNVDESYILVDLYNRVEYENNPWHKDDDSTE